MSKPGSPAGQSPRLTSGGKAVAWMTGPSEADYVSMVSMILTKILNSLRIFVLTNSQNFCARF